MENKILRDKNKIKVFSSLLIIVLLVMGVSFAIFQNFARQSGTNNLGATNCFSVTFEGVNNAINLANDYPIPDSEGLERDPYTFKVTNNCNQYLSLSIGVETLSTSEIPSNLVKGVIVNNGGIPTSAMLLSSGKTMEAQNGGTAYELLTDGLGANSSKTYDLRLWFDESMTKEQGASKKYQGKVIVGASAEVAPIPAPNGWHEAAEGTLLASLRNSNTLKTPITTPGAAISTADEALLASTEDDYGTSYYFRGAVTNNYVEFANKCWRIVRVGGDGSVKLILHNDNTVGAANPCDAANNSASAAFARYSGTTYESTFNTNYNDNAYVGFKYGTVGSSTYEATHENTNNSTILTNLETWYTNNLKDYADTIADNVWCNDKTNVTDITYNPWNMSNVNGLGYGTNKIYYGATQRLISTSNSAGGTGPSLKCNGELNKITSKVGLITADELALAGYAYNIRNTTTYLQENATYTYWWSLSPSSFDGSYACVWCVYGSFGLFYNRYVSNTGAVRPSISLKSTTNVTGSGTSEDPFKVV